jgi:hypothetical protein
VMPCLPGTPLGRKFNAFYALDDAQWDTMIYLDCDIVVLNDLAELLLGVGDAEFAAMPAGKQVMHRYNALLLSLTGMSEDELAANKNDAFSTQYPLFNSGVFVAGQQAVNRFRRDVIKIFYDLQQVRCRSWTQYLRFEYNDRLMNPKYASFSIQKYCRHVLKPLGCYFPLWCAEQIGLAAAILKNHVQYRLLESRCNWNAPRCPPDGRLPVLFHYMKGLYPIDRDRLFDGDWISAYQVDSAPMQQQLSTLAGEFHDLHVREGAYETH